MKTKPKTSNQANEFDKFAELAKNLISVPKSEILAKEEKEKAGKPKK